MTRIVPFATLAAVIAATLAVPAAPASEQTFAALDRRIDAVIDHCESVLPPEGGRVAVFPLLQSKKIGARSSHLGEEVAARIAERIEDRLGDRVDVLYDFDLIRELEEQNRVGRDFADALDAADLAMRCRADFVITGSVEVFPRGFSNDFEVKLYGIPVENGRSARRRLRICYDGRLGPGDPENALWRWMDESRRRPPANEYGALAEPQEPDPLDELRVAVQYVAWKMLRDHGHVIGNRRVVIRPAALPSCARQHRYLDNLYFRLQEEHDRLAMEAFDSGVDTKRLLDGAPVEIDGKRYPSWSLARRMVERYGAKLRMTDGGMLESQLGDRLNDHLNEMEYLAPDQIGAPRRMLESLMRSHRGGKPGVAAEPEEYALLLMPLIDLSGTKTIAKIVLFDSRTGERWTRSVRIRGRVGKSVSRSLIEMERGRRPVDIAGELLEVGDPRGEIRVEPPPPEPGETDEPVATEPTEPADGLDHVHLVVAWLGSGADRIGKALLTSPALADVGSRSGRKLRSANDIYPARATRCEVRFRADDADAARVAAEIERRLRDDPGQLGIHGSLIKRLEDMSPTSRGVRGDPIAMVLGHGAPDGMLPILILLVR